MSGTAHPDLALGLTAEEARRRLAAAGERRAPRGSRSYAEIVRENTLTLFNAILLALWVPLMVFGDPRDGLFIGILIANALIGIVQELRAKRVLDRLALLVAPQARVWRDGALVELPVGLLVPGDAVRLEPGDQVVADGVIRAARSLQLDESMLSGEADPVARGAGDDLRSGAWCVAGGCDYEVTAVGADSWAEQLALEARSTRSELSPLQLAINTILRATVIAMVPLALFLAGSIALRGGVPGVQEHGAVVTKLVAALSPLVPEGLVLLASLTFAVAAVRLARVGALAQRLNAVESLAGADIVCIDKTGTLTERRLDFVGLEPLGAGAAGAERALAALAASAGSRNPTLEAVAAALPAAPAALLAEVPFSSARKWSAVELEDLGTLVLGAPEVLAAAGAALDGSVHGRLAALAAERRRVLLLCRADGPLDGEAAPGGLEPLGLVVLEEALRPEARATVAFLTRAGVQIRVLSGDATATVQAVALAVGIPGAERGVDGGELPTDDGPLARAVEAAAVVGRTTPEQKRAIVRALRAAGRRVAMVGDGVNDVLALKEAQPSIAMGSGSQMAKGVADLVLLRDDFGTVPQAIAEGRRIIRNTQRTAALFVTKSVWAAVLLLGVGLLPLPYPFLPRHLTVIATLTVGIPGFVVALSPSSGAVRTSGFLRELARFAIPAGVAEGLGIIVAYLAARRLPDGTLGEARSAAVLTALVVGIAVLLLVERGAERRPIPRRLWLVIGGVAVIAALGPRIPALRRFFALDWPSLWPSTAALAGCAVSLLLLALVQRSRVRAARRAG